MATTLILGASGYIGSHLFNRMRRDGFDVIGTYYKNKNAGLVNFDLENMEISGFLDGLGAGNIKYLVILAARNANIDDSKRFWKEVHYANVEKVAEVVDYCAQKDIIPIYASTDNVFSGEKGKYAEDDKREPLNCYGRIRYEVENHIMRSAKEYVILRMGKVFGVEANDGTFITDMVGAIGRGRGLSYAVDQVFTPLYVEDFIDALKGIITNGYSGIFHLASMKPSTRYELATDICNFFNFRKGDIVPCKINSLGLLDARPLRIDLDIAKYKAMTGFSEKGIEHYLNLIAVNKAERL